MDESVLGAPAFFTTRQATDLLGVSAPTVIKWVKEGRLDAHVTPGGHRRISRDALRDFADRSGIAVNSSHLVHAHGAEAGLRVMVVDPEPDYSELVSEYFRLQGSVHVLQCLEPVRVGFDMATFRPHVIVFDVSTPRVPVREILKLAADQGSVKVILLSSNWSTELSGVATDFEFAQVVQKPVKLDQLWAMVSPERISAP